MANITTLTDDNFQTEVLDTDLPVLIDFWADWCHPCRLIEPTIESIAEERSGSLKVLKLNIDENPEVTGRFGVMSIPTVMLLVGGVEKTRVVGAVPKPVLLGEIEPFLSEAAEQSA